MAFKNLRILFFFLNVLFLFMFIGAACASAEEISLYPEGVYDPAISSPEKVLGYPLGERLTHHTDLLRYFEILSRESPHAKLISYGKTHEGRTLFYLAVSSPDYLTRLSEIQEMAKKLSDPRVLDPGEARRMVREMPAIAWMAYSIHGDELSSTEAAILLAYRLVTGTDPNTVKLRDSLVILIDPLQNPDGRERFLSQLQYLNGAVPNPDINSLQHTGFWPWGRGNHYLFDLNRDWFTLVQPESQARIAAILEWHPHLLVDSHEMGPDDTYYFSPPREPFNPHMTETLKKWWDIFAQDQAEAFDQQGWSYYTRGWNEEWFPGYGSSWPAYTGAISILYEQASTEGTVVKRSDGTLLSYRQAIHHQFVSSLSNLMTLARHKEDILQDYLRERTQGIERGKIGKVRAFLLLPAPDPARTAHLIKTLLRQGIEVAIAREPFTTREVQNYWGEESGRDGKTFPAGTYLIRLDQPAGPLIRAILEFHTPMSDSFLREERERLERQKGSQLYDVTAWSVSLAYGSEAFWAGKIPEAQWEPLSISAIPSETGRIEHPRPTYGYLLDGSKDASIDAVAKLLAEGYNIRVAEKEFTHPLTHSEKKFPRGSFLLRNETNPQNLLITLETLARETGIIVYGVDTARSKEGPDLGGNEFRLLQASRIGVVTGPPVNYTAYGALWHLLDREMGIRFSSLDLARLSRLDLSRYNVLVFPPLFGSHESYSRILGKDGVAKLKRWIEAGGTFVGIGQGAFFAADTENGLSQVRLRHQVLKTFPSPNLGLSFEALVSIGLMEATGFVKGSPKKILSNPSDAAWPTLLGIPGSGSPLVGKGAVPFLEGFTGTLKNPEEESAKEPGVSKDMSEEERMEALKRMDERLRRFQPRGCIVRVDLDHEHWLSAGLEARVPAILYTEDAYIARDPVRTVGRLARPEELHLSGLLWPEAAGRWAYTAYITQEKVGKGQIILFAGDPIFRGYFRATQRLLKNALFLGPGLGTEWSAPW